VREGGEVEIAVLVDYIGRVNGSDVTRMDRSSCV
jgi:hypothetical protein